MILSVFKKISKLLDRIFNYLKIDKDTLLFLGIISVSKFIPGKIEEKLILLGGSGGDAFIGNTKYLYKFLERNSDYRVYYVVKSKKLKKELEKQNIDTLYAYSLETVKKLRKAHYIFVTHGLGDIIPIKFSPQTIFVQTWHGVQNKKLTTKYKKQKTPKWVKFLGLNTENKNIYDYFLTPTGTEKDKNIISQHFEFPKERIIPLGYPRNDIFFNKGQNLYEKLRKKYNIPPRAEKIILYAPTFRDEKLIADFPLNNQELKTLNKYLKKIDGLFIIKAHPNEKMIEFKDFSHFRKIDQNADIQELLYITDILITDYSSVYCDFLLLDRPILFFTYDFEEFMKKGRGFYYDFKEIAPGPFLDNGQELIEAIQNIDILEEKFRRKRKKTLKIFHKYQDGNSTERILKYFKINYKKD